MEAMRYSDMKVTAKTCTDAGMLPTRAAVCSLPPFLSNCTPICSPDLGADGHSMSPADTFRGTVKAGLRGVRKMSAEQMHMALGFLGDADLGKEE